MGIDRSERAQAQQLLGEVLAAIPTEALPPPHKRALQSRLNARLEREQVPFLSIRESEGAWHELLPGIRIKPLRANRQEGTQTSLWRLSPNAEVPRHAHHLDEECLVLSGQVRMGEQVFCAGDYVIAPSGSQHMAFWADAEALLLIRGELDPRLEPLFAQVIR